MKYLISLCLIPYSLFSVGLPHDSSYNNPRLFAKTRHESIKRYLNSDNFKTAESKNTFEYGYFSGECEAFGIMELVLSDPSYDFLE